MSTPGDPAPLDLRTLGLGAVGWGASLLVVNGQRTAWVVAVLVLVVVAWLRRGSGWPTWAGWVLAAAAVGTSAVLHLGAVARSPVRDLADVGASVQGLARVTSAPAVSHGRFADRVTFSARIEQVSARGRSYRAGAAVLVLAGLTGPEVRRGSVVRFSGTLRPADRPERAAELTVRGDLVVLAGPGRTERAAASVRTAISRAVAGQPAGPRALVPALVDGDDGGLGDRLEEDFRTTGLTHLTAVSGTNLTIILACLLAVARWCRVRGRWLIPVGLVGVVGFVLLAGPQPSVLRAAAMGTIALLGLHAGGQQRGLRSLGLGVLVLLLVDPWLASSLGFALSVSATAGILLLVPRWTAALQTWLPRWLAEALAIPLAAQVACTPLIAAVSASVSLVAVAANLVVAPLVAPATVLGLVGGLVALVSVPCGAVVAAPAAWSAGAIIAVARQGAALSLPALQVPHGALPVVVLVVLCAGAAARGHRFLARRGPVLAVTGLVTTAVLVPLPTPGWPPPGWVLVACSVGQGDALVLSAGPGSAVVVDAGPDPRPVDRCLDRLGVRAVPVLVLTHFHADHVDGLAGVLDGRRVGEVVTSPLADPEAAARSVQSVAGREHIPVRPAVRGETTTVGDLTWTVLAPSPDPLPDSDSPPNDASVVLLVEVRGTRILLMGDEERPSQALLRRDYPDLRADVLKVAHHGSSKQDVALVESLGARLAVISVGRDNDYGHPAPSALDLLSGAGMAVRRTDLDGDVAVVVDDAGRLGTVLHRVR